MCWDKFPQLAIQLIPVADAVAFFYPPAQTALTIHVFYEPDLTDFSRPLFLLFHEAGHLVQWLEMAAAGRDQEFKQQMELDKGEPKVQFERDAWQNGESLLSEFVAKKHLNHYDLQQGYKEFAKICLSSYKL
ncbi:MAG: hypothetical protein ONB27_11910 [candidate division KSB1 bacterium]|nr:hypothetical protein [candidate division KSB1 bacterium]